MYWLTFHLFTGQVDENQNVSQSQGSPNSQTATQTHLNPTTNTASPEQQQFDNELTPYNSTNANSQGTWRHLANRIRFSYNGWNVMTLWRRRQIVSLFSNNLYVVLKKIQILVIRKRIVFNYHARVMTYTLTDERVQTYVYIDWWKYIYVTFNLYNEIIRILPEIFR